MNKSSLPILACILFLISGILMLAAAVCFLHSSASPSHQPYIPEQEKLPAPSADPPVREQNIVVLPSATAAPCSSHTWKNGVCTVCGEICSHPDHDPETQLCPVCGEKVCHQYRNLLCPCGKKLVAEELYIEPTLFSPSSDPGHIETIEYETPDYSGNSGRTYTKKMDVYLPSGYSNETKYNVVLMFPGTGSDHTYWFGIDHPYKYPDETVISFNLCNLFDNMISSRICEPFIAVSLTYYKDSNERSTSDNYDRLSSQLSRELKNNILPAVISRYSTYAEGTDASSLSAAREHFGYIGASAGSILGVRSALMENPDIFGWFGFLSGCKTPSSSIVSALQENQNPENSICGLYAAAGSEDSLRQGTYDAYNALYDSGLISESNSIYNDIQSAAHEDRAWITGIFNCLQLFFN